MKIKLTEDKKTLLIYSGELLFFAILFLVLGLLEIFNVINLFSNHPYLFYYVSLGGAILGIILFIYNLIKKKTKFVDLIDKILLLPTAIIAIPYDVYYLINGENLFIELRYFLSILLLYNSLNYLFQAIYHWYKPISGLIDDETKNLIIRRFKESDLKDIKKIFNDEVSIDNLLYTTDYYAITLKENKNIIGMVYLHDDDDKANLEFSFVSKNIDESLILEALKFLIRQAFKNKIVMIRINIKSNNLNKIKIISDVGFTKIKEENDLIYFELNNNK